MVRMEAMGFPDFPFVQKGLERWWYSEGAFRCGDGFY